MMSSISKCVCAYLRNYTEWVATWQNDTLCHVLSKGYISWRHRKRAWADDVIRFKICVTRSQELWNRLSWNLAQAQLSEIRRFGQRKNTRKKYYDVIKSGRGLMSSSVLKYVCLQLRKCSYDWVETWLSYKGCQVLQTDQILWRQQKWTWPDDAIDFKICIWISQETHIRLSYNLVQ